MSEAPKLEVRPLEPADVDSIVDYWTKAPAKELERMGANPEKIPSPQDLSQALQKIYKTPDKEKTAAYSIWMVNEKAIGFSSLKNIVFGNSGEMHLHIWDPAFRGKGYGPLLFCKSALDFYQRFYLKRLKCEPRSSNPFPNKMFHKIGFPLVRTHVAASSELSLVCELNEYNIRRDIAESYLHSIR